MEKKRKVASRPLTEDEKKLLQRQIASSSSSSFFKDILGGTAYFTFILYCVGFILWRWIGPKLGFGDDSVAARLIFFAAALAISLYSFTWPMAKQRYAGKWAVLLKKQKDELSGGVASAEMLTVTAVYELPEFEDEGVGFFLELDDGRVLFVQGQDLYEHAHDFVEEEGHQNPSTFPSTSILYSYGPHTGQRFSIESLGVFLKPQVLQKIDYKRKMPRNGYPEDGVFYDGNAEGVFKKFKLKRAGSV